jgi:hypothetical protein
MFLLLLLKKVTLKHSVNYADFEQSTKTILIAVDFAPVTIQFLFQQIYIEFGKRNVALNENMFNFV